MPKHKKTRKQKLLSDSRRQTAVLAETPIQQKAHEESPNQKTYSLKDSIPSSIPQTASRTQTVAQRSISTQDYSYLKGDLYKTLFLTGFIVVAELAVKFLVKI